MAGVNKVNYGNQVVIDISDSTVSPSTLLEGIKAYGANGDPVTGTLKLAYHITLTPEQYLELIPEERKASDCWYYLRGVKKAGGLFQRPANSGWQLTEDEVTTYNYNSHEIMIAAANGSAYVELQNGWNNVSELPTDYAPGSVLTFSAFFEDTTTWVISPIMMRVRPNGMIDVASEGAHNGNLYFSYNYLRENQETDDAWYYTQASDVPYALVDDEQTTTNTAWSSSKIVRELAAVNQNIAAASSSIDSALNSMCQNYTRLFSLASNNTWADVTVNDITQYRKLVFCLTRQAAGSTNICLTNPISVSVNFFKNTLTNGSNYLHIYTIKKDTSANTYQICDGAVYYVNDTTVKFYGAGPWNWELYGIK